MTGYAELSNFLALNDLAAGERLGWPKGTKQAANRGKQAKGFVAAVVGLANGEKLALHDARGVTKDNLDSLFEHFPRLLLSTEGYLPRSLAMMAIVADRLGVPIKSENLSAANEVCSEVVNEVMGPRLRRFVRETLGSDGHVAPLGEDGLISFLTGPYAQFAKAEANGLVSRAGSLNEALVREAIKAAGLLDAIQTGTEGNADIQIVTKSMNPPQILSIEVKSYGARERLIRGLHDCKAPKVGVGFFNKSSEFNSDRTSLLLATNASAIYLPELTLSGLDGVTRARQNSHGGQFYRPLGRFGSDMKQFAHIGVKAFAP